MKNSIMLLKPYLYLGSWVFDDERVDLVREPFVSGSDRILDVMTAEIPDAQKGFKLIFSENPFPGHTACFDLTRPEGGGNWYRWKEKGMDGWLCPALFHYFSEAPKKLYAKAEAFIS